MTGHRLPWARVVRDVPVPLSVVDTLGRHVTCNSAFAALFGYTIEEVDALEVALITRPEDREWTAAYLARLARGELSRFESDKWYVHRDGTRFKARLSVARTVDDSETCDALLAAILPAMDPGDRRPDDNRALRLLAHARESITLIDRSGEVRFSTGELSDIAGYPGSFWAGRDIREVLRDRDLGQIVADRPDFFSTPGAVVDTEVEVERGDGGHQVSSIRAVNCLDDPELRGFVVVARDVTDERAHVAELAERSLTAEAVADARTRLLATVSHELRNPLHAVRGLAEILSREELPERASELAASLARQLSGLANVTQDLLDAARLDAGEIEITPTPTDIAVLVRDVTELGVVAAAGKGILVSSRIEHGVPGWVMADGDRLRQILDNLVGNAVKFTDAGSVQTIVHPAGDEFVMFSVVDTGPGIPAADLTTVLEPFKVGSATGGRSGAGLGLSIVERLVGAMGGRLSLSSTVGEGTRFDIVVPLRATTPPVARLDIELPAGLRVLVVEDNPVNRQLACSQLERLRVEAITAERGEAALGLLLDPHQAPIDAVLMDEQLPGWSGTEATRRIRASGGALADIPIIGLSASASPSDRDAFLAAGMSDFVAKPASLADVAEALQRAVRREAQDEQLVDPAAVTGDVVAPVLDRGVLARLGAELGSFSTVHELVTSFIDLLDDRVRLIIDGGDAGARAAHTLGSAARLLGADRLAEACDAGPEDEAGAARLTRLAARTKGELEAWRGER
ncbi:MAG: response regulator [Ilumatobacter sp.]|nr:response regulator [Ilumatobacter sp.]